MIRHYSCFKFAPAVEYIITIYSQRKKSQLTERFVLHKKKEALINPMRTISKLGGEADHSDSTHFNVSPCHMRRQPFMRRITTKLDLD